MHGYLQITIKGIKIISGALNFEDFSRPIKSKEFGKYLLGQKLQNFGILVFCENPYKSLEIQKSPFK
jgi:hypothetical protein